MPSKKTKDELLAEKISAEKKLEQCTHQLQRAVISFAILVVLFLVFGRKFSI